MGYCLGMGSTPWRCLIFALLLSGCGKGGQKAPVDAGGPAIAFEAAAHDFGTVSEGDKLRHIFVVKNTGNAPLLINGAHASCGCTVAALKTKTVAPGGTGEIDVTVNTQGKVGHSQTTITVDSNAAGQAHVTATLTANVERLLALDSGYVRLMTDYGLPRVEKVWLTGKLVGDAHPKVLKVESTRRADTTMDGDPDPILDALGARPIQERAGDMVRKGLEIKLKGDKVSSGFGRVIVATGLPKPEQLELQLSWAVTGGTLQVDPGDVIFGSGPTDAHRRVLRVWSKKPNFRLSRVRVLDGPFKAALEKPESPGVFRVSVTWNGSKPGNPGETRAGKLQLVSNDPAEPEKVVALRVQ